jgi:hypothetical protein
MLPVAAECADELPELAHGLPGLADKETDWDLACESGKWMKP